MILLTKNGTPVTFLRESAGDEHYITTRKAIRKAIALVKKSDGPVPDCFPIRVRRSSFRYRNPDYNQAFHVSASSDRSAALRLGCCHFGREEAEKIQRWANRRTK